MEKLKLNNEIVSMRHSVRKAKVHVVHRLTREINKLKNRKGNEKQVEKCKRKAERLKEELISIKKLKNDDVSKFAIKNTRTLEEILTHPQSTCLERVLARLVCHRDVMTHVQKLRSEPVDWVSFLDDLGSQTKMKKKKQQKSKQPKNLETIEPGQFVRIRCTSNSEDLTSDMVINEENGTKDDASEQNHKKRKHSKKIVKNNESKPKKCNPVASDSLQYSARRKHLQYEGNVSSDNNNNFSESLDEESEHLSGGKFVRSSAGESLKSLQPDPFFLTDEGEYLSSIVKTESLGNEEETRGKPGNSNNKLSKNYIKMNRNQKGRNTFNGEVQAPIRSGHKYRNINEERRGGNAKEKKRFQGKHLKGTHVPQIMQNKKQKLPMKDSQDDRGISLHPSWEAKRKMQQQQQLNIHAFQGKKIKFDDDD